MMRPTTPIAALTVVTAVDHALTMNTVQSVNAIWEILVSASVRLFANKILANMKRKITINFFQMMKVFRNYCNCQYTLVLAQNFKFSPLIGTLISVRLWNFKVGGS